MLLTEAHFGFGLAFNTYVAWHLVASSPLPVFINQPDNSVLILTVDYTMACVRCLTSTGILDGTAEIEGGSS